MALPQTPERLLVTDPTPDARKHCAQHSLARMHILNRAISTGKKPEKRKLRKSFRSLTLWINQLNEFRHLRRSALRCSPLRSPRARRRPASSRRARGRERHFLCSTSFFYSTRLCPRSRETISGLRRRPAAKNALTRLARFGTSFRLRTIPRERIDEGS